MKDTPRIATALVGFAMFSVLWGCTKKQPDPLMGVWKVTNIVNLDEKTESDPGNMHYIVTKGFIRTVGGKDDRPVINKNFANMTPEEILSQLPAGGGFMKYEVKGGKIHRTTQYALSEYFEGKLIITEYEVEASKLIFRDNHHADGQLREWHMVRVE